MRIHKRRKFVKIVFGVLFFFVDWKKKDGGTIRPVKSPDGNFRHSISKGMATRSERDVRIGVLK